jgi:hypothetical protein
MNFVSSINLFQLVCPVQGDSKISLKHERVGVCAPACTTQVKWLASIVVHFICSQDDDFISFLSLWHRRKVEETSICTWGIKELVKAQTVTSHIRINSPQASAMGSKAFQGGQALWCVT